MFEDDDEYTYYHDDLECDCMEEDYDILEGRAHCWQCGSSRWLSSEELTLRLELETKLQAEYDRQCEEWDKDQEAAMTDIQPDLSGLRTGNYV